jgi:multiple sugar transport system substrate-binding protein
MTQPTFRGLTWDHPRGRDALVAAAEASDLDLVWDVHPLSGFESTPIEEIAADYDLVVLDHPHLGDAVAHGCLQSFDDLVGHEQVAAWADAAVGPSLASYVMDGRLWAVPLDAATQVAATRADLVDVVPRRWAEVAALSRRAPVALSVAGPHALLTFSSVCVALGEEPGGAGAFVSEEVGRQALELMADLAARVPRHTLDLDPIGLLAEMTAGDTLAHVPLVYGYVTYADTALDRPVRFTDAPTLTPGTRPGSTLGGTGLAITALCEVTPELLDHVRHLMSGPVQEDFIPAHAGQPSARAAWTSSAVNEPVGDFYRGTLETVERAWVRPRHPDYVTFQTEAAEVVREALAGSISIAAALGRIDDGHLATLAHPNPDGAAR